MHNLASLAVITAACLAAAPHLAAQQPARIDVPAAVSVRLPAGWQAGSREATQLQLVPANLVPGKVVFIASASANGATSLTDPAGIRSTEQEMLQLFPVVRRDVGGVHRHGHPDGTAAPSRHARNENGQLRRHTSRGAFTALNAYSL